MMEYKGYIGKVVFDDESGVFCGNVINTRDVITFQGKSVAALRRSFRQSIDYYLAFCKERGERPDKPLSGKFVVRMSPDLHQRISTKARLADKSLNKWVQEVLDAASREG